MQTNFSPPQTPSKSPKRLCSEPPRFLAKRELWKSAARPPAAAAAPRGARRMQPRGPASFRPSKQSHHLTFLPLFPTYARLRPVLRHCSEVRASLRPGAGKAMRRDRVQRAPLTPLVLTVVCAIAATSDSELPNHLLSSFTYHQSLYH